jgi:hypothetical protein
VAVNFIGGGNWSTWKKQPQESKAGRIRNYIVSDFYVPTTKVEEEYRFTVVRTYVRPDLGEFLRLGLYLVDNTLYWNDRFSVDKS